MKNQLIKLTAVYVHCPEDFHSANLIRGSRELATFQEQTIWLNASHILAVGGHNTISTGLIALVSTTATEITLTSSLGWPLGFQKKLERDKEKAQRWVYGVHVKETPEEIIALMS
jgi:hypothetical protein